MVWSSISHDYYSILERSWSARLAGKKCASGRPHLYEVRAPAEMPSWNGNIIHKSSINGGCSRIFHGKMMEHGDVHWENQWTKWWLFHEFSWISTYIQGVWVFFNSEPLFWAAISIAPYPSPFFLVHLVGLRSLRKAPFSPSLCYKDGEEFFRIPVRSPWPRFGIFWGPGLGGIWACGELPTNRKWVITPVIYMG